MTSVAVPRIDWRQQVASLEPYFAGCGGVVRVTVSQDSPASTFSKLIRQLMAERRWDRPWTTVQFDASNPNTHYLSDIVVQLSHSLKLDESETDTRGRVLIGTHAQANVVEISNVTVNYEEDHYDRAQRLFRRLTQIADAIEERLQTERVGLIFLNSHTFDQATLSSFRQTLWDDQLAAMTRQGLLLIDISDPARDCGPVWPPDSDLLLDLPERFDDGARTDAKTDLAALALSEGIAEDRRTAAMFAETLVQSSDRIKDLYAGLARIRAKRGTSL